MGKIYEEETEEKSCLHDTINSVAVVKCNQQKLCTLVDTGSQISIIGDKTWKKIKQGEKVENYDIKLCGIDGEINGCLGVTNLIVEVDDKICAAFPFAIVKEEFLPSCLLLGINFLESNKSIVNFSKGIVCLLYTSPSPRDKRQSRMPSSA